MAQTRTMTDSGSDPTDPRKPDPDSGNGPLVGAADRLGAPEPRPGLDRRGTFVGILGPGLAELPAVRAGADPSAAARSAVPVPAAVPAARTSRRTSRTIRSRCRATAPPPAIRRPIRPQSYPEAPAPGGYGSNPYEVNPYQGAYPGYAAYGPPPNHPQAVTAFVLGLVGLVVCTPVGIGGLVIGGRVRKEIDAAPGQYSGRGLATAGWVLGIISVVLLGAGCRYS